MSKGVGASPTKTGKKGRSRGRPSNRMPTSRRKKNQREMRTYTRRPWAQKQEVGRGTLLLRGTNHGSEAFVDVRAIGSATPSSTALPDKAGNRAAILKNQCQPRQWTHLGEIDSPETHSGDENVYPIAQRLVLERIDSLNHGLGAIRMSPPGFHLSMCFLNGHLQRRVSHRKRYEFPPVLRARQSPRSLH